MKKKILVMLSSALMVGISFVGMNSHAEASINTSFSFDICDHNHNSASEFGKFDLMDLSSKKQYRCKICGKTFNTGIMVAGHIKGNHGKFLIHKYYEKI